MSKPIFPNSNPCGRLFNDFLDEKPIMQIYAVEDRIVWSDNHSIEAEMPQSKDHVHITHQNGEVSCIEYETTSNGLIEEIKLFLNVNFKKKSASRMDILDFYDVYKGKVYASILELSGTHYLGIRRL